MSEKKELNQEQLEKVSGGYYIGTTPECIDWNFTKDAQVYVELTDCTKVEGKVTKRAYMGFPSGKNSQFFDYYYIESSVDTNVNGWYLGEYFSNKTVSINYKYDGLFEPVVCAW